MFYGSDSDSSDNEDDNPSPTGRGHRVRVAPKNYTLSHNNQTYGESHVDTSMDSPPALKSRKTGTSSRGNNRLHVVSPRCGNISRRALNQFVINAYLNQQQAQGIWGGLDYLPPSPSREDQGVRGGGESTPRSVKRIRIRTSSQARDTSRSEGS